MSTPSHFAGFYNATEFAYGVNKTTPALLVIGGPNTTTGAQALQVAFGYTQCNDGTVFNPLNTNAPITVGGNSSTETVTPSAVSASTPTIYSSTSVTSTFANLHGNGDMVRTGTCGLQEALNYAGLNGGGIVVVDARWTQLGGTDAMIEAAAEVAGVSIQDNRTGGEPNDTTITLTAAQVNTMFTTSVPLLPPPGVGSFYIVQQGILVNENGGTAWTAGGAITIGYSSANPGSPNALSGTIAATFLTTPTVKQIITLAGVQTASAAESTLDNLGVYISNATQVFATGTGVLKIRLLYTLVKT